MLFGTDWYIASSCSRLSTSEGRKDIAAGSRVFSTILLYTAVDSSFSPDAFSSKAAEFVTRTVGLEDREHSDTLTTFVLVSDCDSFLENDGSFFDILIDDDDDEEEADRVIFESTSMELTFSCTLLSSMVIFESSSTTVTSSESTLVPATNGRANDSGGFTFRTMFPSSLNGIPSSWRVVHTSLLGLQEEPRGNWAIFILLASSIECHRCDLAIDDPGAIAFKLFAGTIL